MLFLSLFSSAVSFGSFSQFCVRPHIYLSYYFSSTADILLVKYLCICTCCFSLSTFCHSLTNAFSYSYYYIVLCVYICVWLCIYIINLFIFSYITLSIYSYLFGHYTIRSNVEVHHLLSCVPRALLICFFL